MELDVSELKKRFHESEAKFALVMEASGVGYWDWNLQTDVVHLSRRWKEMLGYKYDEIDNSLDTWSTLVDDDGRVRTMALIDACLKGEQDKFSVEFQMRHKDGSWIDILSFSLMKRDDEGKGIRLIGYHMDISEAKQKSRELEDSEQRYRMLFENMVDGFTVNEMVFDEKGNAVDYIFRDMNTVFLERVGISREMIIDKRCLDLFPATENSWIQKFAGVALGGEPLHFTDYSAALDRYYETKVYSPERGFIVATFADVTDQHRASDALIEAKNQVETSNKALTELNLELEARVLERTLDLNRSLEELTDTQEKLVQTEKIAALSGLVGGIAHEINTPLGIAITAQSYIAEKILELENQELDVDSISGLMSDISEMNTMLANNLNRTADLVRTFKMTAADEYGDQLQVFAVREKVEEAVIFTTTAYPDIHCQVHIDCSPGLTIKTNPVFLYSIVTNLLNNSMIHGFSEQEDPTVQISVACIDGIFTLAYRDNGSGIDPKIQDKIFDPFVTTGRSKGSTGLGLNIVHNLIYKRMEGRIDYEPTESGGVNFIITAPMAAS